MRSPVRVQLQDEITPKGGKDQGVTSEHSQGLKRKDRTSCEKTPYLKRGDDVAKIMQLKGFKSKMMRGPTWKKGRPNRAKVGLGRSAQAIRPTHFLASVRPPFLEREDDATLSHCGLHHSQRTETSTREVVHKGERLERREIIR
jgi:hypothetical protein